MATVHVQTPLAERFAACAAALRDGAHVLTEQPLAATVAECEQLIEVAHERGLVLLAGPEFRLSPQWGRVRRLIEEGTTGAVHAVTIDLCRAAPGPFFDLACWWMREQGAPVWVYARSTQGNRTSIIEFESGALATLTEAPAIPEPRVTARIVGEHGALIATWGEQGASLKLFDEGHAGEIPIDAPGADAERAAVQAHFEAVVAGAAEPVLTASDAARAVALDEAAARSVRSGEAERLEV